MMRRLEKEITKLKDQLEQIRSQKNTMPIEKIQREINQREIQFIGSYDRLKRNKKDINRRRTWCSNLPADELTSVPEEGDMIFGVEPSNRVSFPNIDFEHHRHIVIER